MSLLATDSRRRHRPGPRRTRPEGRGGRDGWGVPRALLAAAWLVALAATEGSTAPLGLAAPQLSATPGRMAMPGLLPAPPLSPEPSRSAGSLLSAMPAKTAKSSAAPSAAGQGSLSHQAFQALDRGDLRRGCPLLRRAIDQSGALVARKPSPALEAELRGLVKRLQPCLRQGL